VQKYVSKLEKVVFERNINEDFFLKFNMYLLFEDEVKEATYETFSLFIDDIKKTYLNIKKESLSKFVSSITNEDIVKKIKNEYLYKLIEFTNELLKLKLERRALFEEELTFLYTISPNNDDLINGFIKKLKEKVEEIINTKSKKEIKKYKEILLKEIFTIIDVYYEAKSLSSIAKEYESLLDEIEKSSNISLYSTLSKFKDLFSRAFIETIESKSNIESENSSDLYSKLSIISFDDDIIKKAVVNYICDTYEVFKTNLDFVDKKIGGIESENIYVICAPSNHGKSLMLIQLAKKLIESNLDKFDENDAILFVTLEDNKIKLSRRIFSIFGNIHPKAVKELFVVGHRKAKKLKHYYKDEEKYNEFKTYFENLINSLYLNAIYNVCQNKVKFFIQDRADSQYSSSDLLQTISTLKLRNINVRCVFIDYIDLMNSTRNYDSDYNEQGQIIKDLRALAKEFHIPIVTVTQLKREAEDNKKELSNALMGDSYKKVRNSDYILMMRQVFDATIEKYSEHYGFDLSLDSNILEDIINQTIPVEYAYTKLKDTDKTLNLKSYLIFSKFNLQFYDNFSKLVNDYKENKANTEKVIKIIENIENYEKFILNNSNRINNSNNTNNITNDNNEEFEFDLGI